MVLPPTASPAEVRNFLTNLLITHRGIPLDHAQHIASHWTLGSGREISTYSATICLQVFGYENGWILYKEIKILQFHDKQQQKKMSKRRTQLYGKCPAFSSIEQCSHHPYPVFILALLVWNASMLHLFISSKRYVAANPWAGFESSMAFAAFGLFFGVAGMWFFAEKIYLDWNYDPEEAAEEELRDATRRIEKE